MPTIITKTDLKKISDALYEIPKNFNPAMHVPARIFTNEAMLGDILQDRSLLQISNVAQLPGIQKYAYAMPDIHQGYGFPIGGVAATAIAEDGVISPGGIGYDINCGVRLLAANITADEILPYLENIATAIYHKIPSGVGHGTQTALTPAELDDVLTYGAESMLRRGYGVADDITFCEEQGRMHNAQPDKVSTHAKERGKDQIGTLGSGNHFLEIQKVEEIYEPEIAKIFGIEKNMVTIMIHCGSRGLGHQVCTDYVNVMLQKLDQWGIALPDKELSCAPFNSPEGQAYYNAMAAAANFAWANRHMIGHWVREIFAKGINPSVTVRTIYDVSHNIGKKETHLVDGKQKELLVHRKGATRAFGPNNEHVPLAYRSVGHPVLIPGTMGTSSYILVGTQEGMETAFGSSCHGAGRRMSRVKAKKEVNGPTLRKQLEDRGIIIRCPSNAGLAEEAPIAYKDVDSVVQVVQEAGLARKVARVVPLAVIKGG